MKKENFETYSKRGGATISGSIVFNIIQFCGVNNVNN